MTINAWIEKTMVTDFEHRIKRNFDCYSAKNRHKLFDFPGLRANPAKGFKKGRVQISA